MTVTARPRDPKNVRAVRNNNPGNVRVGSPWQGLMPREKMNSAQLAETEFCVFETMRHGFRALIRVLIAYKDKHGIDSIAYIARRWAPPSENNTAAYAVSLARMTGFDPEQKLDLHDYDTLRALGKAIATIEAGGWFFDDRDLDAGLRLAGVEPPAAALTQSRTVATAAGAGAAAGAIPVIAELAEYLQPALDVVKRLHGNWPYIVIAVLAAALIAVVVFRVDDHLRARR